MAENLGEAKGYITLDISDFQKNKQVLDSLALSIQNTLTQLEAVSQQLNTTLTQSFNSVADAANTLNTNLSAASSGLNSSVNTINSAAQNLSNNAASSASSVGALQTAAEQLNQTASGLNTTLSQVGNSSHQAETASEGLTSSTTQTTSGFQRARAALQQFLTQLRTLASGFQNTTYTTQQLEAAAKTLEKTFTKSLAAIKKGFQALTAAIAGALTAATAVGSSFESSMSQVASTMGITTEEIQNGSKAFNDLSEAAQKYGAETKYTATQAANALNYLALAGYNTSEAIETLPKVLNLASAGGMELAKASDMITDSAAALGLGIDEIDRLIDEMAVTSQKSNTNVAQLGEGILTVGGTAKILKGGITELNTALGILADNGIKSAEGGTALRQIILNLTNPTDKAAGKMAELGLEVYDIQGNIRGLNEIFGDLSKTLEGASDQEVMDALGTIFDARQLKSATALLANYGDRWDELSGYIDASDGAASDMAQTLTLNLKGAMDTLTSALEATGIRIYESFKEPLTEAVRASAKAVSELSEAVQNPKLQSSLTSIATAVSKLLEGTLVTLSEKILPSLINGLAFIIDNLNAIVAAIGVFGTAIIAYNASLLAAAAKTAILELAQKSLFVTMLANPFTAVAAALSALVAGIIVAVNASKEQVEALKAEHPEYQESIDLINEQKQALEDLNQKTQEVTDEEAIKAEQVSVLVDRLRDYVDESGKINYNEAAAKTIIEQINEIYPDFIKYTENQIENYETLNERLAATTELMRLQALQQGRTELYQEAAKIYAEASAKQDQLAENVKTTTKAYEDAQYAYEHLYSGYVLSEEDKAEMQAAGFRNEKNFLKKRMEVAKENSALANQAQEENKEVLANSLLTMKSYEKDMYSIENDMLKARIDAGEQIEGVYNDQAAAQRGIAEQKAAELEEIGKQRAAEEAEAQAQIQEEMYNKLAAIDYKYNTHKIQDEGDYLNQRLQILEEYQNKESEEWWDLYDKDLDKLEKYNDNKAKEQQQASKEYQQQQEDAAEKEIHQLDLKLSKEEITESEYYDKLELLLTRWTAKGVDLWDKYDTKIVEGRKKLAKETEEVDKKSAKASFKTWSDTIDKTIDKYTEKAEKISESQKTLESNLNSYVNLYTKATKTVRDSATLTTSTEEVMDTSVASLKKQITSLEDFKKKLDKLKEKGASQDLIAEILGMDKDEATEYADALSKMSSKELKKYNEAYTQLQEDNKAFAEEYYASQMDNLEKDFLSEVKEEFGKLPDDLNLVGEDTISGFIEGLETKKSELSGTMATLMGDLITQAKETLDVHSPSKEFETIGEYTIQGQIDGMSNKKEELLNAYNSLGKSAISSMLEGMKTAWADVSTWMTEAILGLQQTLATQALTVAQSNLIPAQGVVTATGIPVQTEGSSGLTKDDIISAIKTAQPDGNIVLTVDKYTFGEIARASLNTVALTSGNMGLKI